MKTWSAEEVDILLRNYNSVTNNELIKLLPKKNLNGIYKKARKLGIKKIPEIEWKNRSEARKREKSSNWKGGSRKTAKGYRQILMPEHPRADRTGYVMEHIVVWENATGSTLPDSCVIHHLNGVKTDNRIENLCAMQRGAHTTFHHTGAKRSEETRKNISNARRNVSC